MSISITITIFVLLSITNYISTKIKLLIVKFNFSKSVIYYIDYKYIIENDINEISKLYKYKKIMRNI